MNWTEIYRHAVGDRTAVVLKREGPAEYVLPPGAKPCRIIPCPGSYFPCHDEQCEMVWEEDDEGFGTWTECACEPRARQRRDGLTEDL